uniref:Protein-serine/threonine phosphatase n=1 Tax=Chromera velia CCMP2878 TaxID=1169474 RepID=A0A0G4FAJ6_9ALVE|eukprot:Cvel_191.t1-p1 / transcript=Cvel_191.t1 / gene=Cvel_191 / organism=Chromera_velia_CCMP2878 / gene_product=Protein-tyrosine-phosphatase MKP1, putative / transcript_product=Protein-tyrosine-phosphatase MKP1, putative / location=Cvel_scaffold11:195475-206212(-) / protein_length=1556 / sequence_SO=supercontig / SO=protein_coding / is_pseudo=false
MGGQVSVDKVPLALDRVVKANPKILQQAEQDRNLESATPVTTHHIRVWEYQKGKPDVVEVPVDMSDTRRSAEEIFSPMNSYVVLHVFNDPRTPRIGELMFCGPLRNSALTLACSKIFTPRGLQTDTVSYTPSRESALTLSTHFFPSDFDVVPGGQGVNANAHASCPAAVACYAVYSLHGKGACINVKARAMVRCFDLDTALRAQPSVLLSRLVSASGEFGHAPVPFPLLESGEREALEKEALSSPLRAAAPASSSQHDPLLSPHSAPGGGGMAPGLLGGSPISCAAQSAPGMEMYLEGQGGSPHPSWLGKDGGAGRECEIERERRRRSSSGRIGPRLLGRMDPLNSPPPIGSPYLTGASIGMGIGGVPSNPAPSPPPLAVDGGTEGGRRGSSGSPPRAVIPPPQQSRPNPSSSSASSQQPAEEEAVASADGGPSVLRVPALGTETAAVIGSCPRDSDDHDNSLASKGSSARGEKGNPTTEGAEGPAAGGGMLSSFSKVGSLMARLDPTPPPPSISQSNQTKQEPATAVSKPPPLLQGGGKKVIPKLDVSALPAASMGTSQSPEAQEQEKEKGERERQREPAPPAHQQPREAKKVPPLQLSLNLSSKSPTTNSTSPNEVEPSSAPIVEESAGVPVESSAPPEKEKTKIGGIPSLRLEGAASVLESLARGEAGPGPDEASNVSRQKRGSQGGTSSETEGRLHSSSPPPGLQLDLSSSSSGPNSAASKPSPLTLGLGLDLARGRSSEPSQDSATLPRRVSVPSLACEPDVFGEDAERLRERRRQEENEMGLPSSCIPSTLQRVKPSLRIETGGSGTGESAQDFSLPDSLKKREMLARYRAVCSPALPDKLFVSGQFVATDRRILEENGITHIINCCADICENAFPERFNYLTYWLKDTKTEDISVFFHQTLEWIDKALEGGGRVLVHCREGVSRSASFAVAYLMWKKRLPFEKAFELVRQTRAVANPNTGFTYQLLLFGKRLGLQPSAVAVSPTGSALGPTPPPSASSNSAAAGGEVVSGTDGVNFNTAAAPCAEDKVQMFRIKVHHVKDDKMIAAPVRKWELEGRQAWPVLDRRFLYALLASDKCILWRGRDCAPALAARCREAAEDVVGSIARVEGRLVAWKEGGGSDVMKFLDEGEEDDAFFALVDACLTDEQRLGVASIVEERWKGVGGERRVEDQDEEEQPSRECVVSGLRLLRDEGLREEGDGEGQAEVLSPSSSSSARSSAAPRSFSGLRKEFAADFELLCRKKTQQLSGTSHSLTASSSGRGEPQGTHPTTITPAPVDWRGSRRSSTQTGGGGSGLQVSAGGKDVNGLPIPLLGVSGAVSLPQSPAGGVGPEGGGDPSALGGQSGAKGRAGFALLAATSRSERGPPNVYSPPTPVALRGHRQPPASANARLRSGGGEGGGDGGEGTAGDAGDGTGSVAKEGAMLFCCGEWGEPLGMFDSDDLDSQGVFVLLEKKPPPLSSDAEVDEDVLSLPTAATGGEEEEEEEEEEDTVPRLWVWCGEENSENLSTETADDAKGLALQLMETRVIPKARVAIVAEGEEPSEFWDLFLNG